MRKTGKHYLAGWLSVCKAKKIKSLGFDSCFSSLSGKLFGVLAHLDRIFFPRFFRLKILIRLSKFIYFLKIFAAPWQLIAASHELYIAAVHNLISEFFLANCNKTATIFKIASDFRRF